MGFDFEGKRLWSRHRNAIGRFENSQFKSLAGTLIQRIQGDRITDPAGTLMGRLRPGMEDGVTEITDPHGTLMYRLDRSGRLMDPHGTVEGFIE